MKLVALLLFCTSALAHPGDIAFDPHLGAQVPAVQFREAPIARYLGFAPVVLVLGYAGCVNLCGTTLEGVALALKDTKLVAGQDYSALWVSIDPRDERTPPAPRPGWHMLTGAQPAARVADAVGFRYRYEKASGEFEHPAGFVLLTPEGRVSSYFEGVRFDAPRLRAAILEASQGRTQSSVETLLLVCFHDLQNGRYTATVLTAIRIAMGVFLLGLGVVAWRHLR